MAVAPSLQQAVGTNTTTAAPANITVASAATQPGSLLVALIAVAASASPAVAPPAGWTVGQTFSSGVIGVFLFYYIANPGGITSSVFTLTNANGACCQFYEVNNSSSYSAIDAQTHLSIATATPRTTPSLTPAAFGEFCCGFFACISGGTMALTFTPNNQPVITTRTQLTSTGGATNVLMQAFDWFNTPSSAQSWTATVTLSGSPNNGNLTQSFLPQGSGGGSGNTLIPPWSAGNIPQGYSGALGGT